MLGEGFLSYCNRPLPVFFVSMNLQIQIRQQQSTVQMLEKLLKAKRCSQAEVDQAKRRLADLQEQVDFKPIVVKSTVVPKVDEPEPIPTGRLIEGDEYNSLQADLSKQADRLNRKMADLSNKLYLVPPGANCPDLVKPILELKAQIESIWDKKRYLERNRFLPEEPADDQEPINLPPTLADAGRYELAYKKRRLTDLRSKLKRKLADPKAKPGKRYEWEMELAKADLEIQEIEVKLG